MSAQPELFFAELDDPEVVETRRAREEAAKREIRRRLRETRRAWVEKIEAELARLYDSRCLNWPEPYVTADDARNLMRTYPHVFGLPAGASNNTLGGMFSGRKWEPVDRDDRGRAIATHTSTTERSNGNKLVRWRYVGDRTDA